ncbi:MAG: hypothetical protein IIC79_02650 [Chloroflexi bacterium]|nr:hypothetical protein [Chloroflexota bacterium]
MNSIYTFWKFIFLLVILINVLEQFHVHFQIAAAQIQAEDIQKHDPKYNRVAEDHKVGGIGRYGVLIEQNS